MRNLATDEGWTTAEGAPTRPRRSADQRAHRCEGDACLRSRTTSVTSSGKPSASSAAVATTAAAVGATSKGSTGEKRHVRARVTGITTG